MSDPHFISSMSRWRRLWNRKQAMNDYREKTISDSSITKQFTNEQLASESIKTMLQTSLITQASEKYRDLIAEKVRLEETIQFNEELVNPSGDKEIENLGLEQNIPLVDDNLVSTSLLNQIDYRGLDR